MHLAPKEFLHTRKYFISYFPINESRAKYLFIFLLLSVAAGTLTAQPFSFNDSTSRIKIKGSPAEVARKIKLSELYFSKEAGNYINYGIAGKEYKYFVLKLNSRSKVEGQYLSIDNTSLDTIEIFRVYANGMAKANDTAVVLAYFTELKQVVYSLNAGRRADGNATLVLPPVSGIAETGIGFVSQDKNDAANSVYTGRLVI